MRRTRVLNKLVGPVVCFTQCTWVWQQLLRGTRSSLGLQTGEHCTAFQTTQGLCLRAVACCLSCLSSQPSWPAWPCTSSSACGCGSCCCAAQGALWACKPVSAAQRFIQTTQGLCLRTVACFLSCLSSLLPGLGLGLGLASCKGWEVGS